MDWNQSRLGYYADFVVVPVLLLLMMHYEAPSLLMVPLGYAFWTFAEYWIHRTLFHWLMRRQHWLHHVRPAGYVAAPAWLAALLHALVIATLAVAFGQAGAGFALGLETGYLVYIGVHDAIHHWRHKKDGGWLRRKWEHHMMHHRGIAEVNFGVAHHVWDHAFGTYRKPPKRT